MAKCKFIVLIILIFFSVTITNSSEDRSSNPDHIYLNYESSLPYGYCIGVHAKVDEYFEIRWEFSGSNSLVGIKVYAMIDTEFAKFKNSQSFNSYQLSDGSHVQDSGTFIPKSNNEWYIVFLNADSNHQTTYLTYDVDFIDKVSILPFLVGLIIFISVVGVIIGVLVVVLHKKAMKKRQMQELDQEIPPVSHQIQRESIENAQSVKFCTNCGKIRRNDTAYCENCGKQF